MEMLHGSDGWGKLVSELQQKEEDDAQQAAMQADQQQQPPTNRHKRGRPLKDSSDPLATRSDNLLLQMYLICKVVILLQSWQLAFTKVTVIYMSSFVVTQSQQIYTIALSISLCCHIDCGLQCGLSPSSASGALCCPTGLSLDCAALHWSALHATSLHSSASHKSHCTLGLLLWYPGAVSLVPWGCFSGVLGLLLWYPGAASLVPRGCFSGALGLLLWYPGAASLVLWGCFSGTLGPIMMPSSVGLSLSSAKCWYGTGVMADTLLLRSQTAARPRGGNSSEWQQH